MQHHGNTSEYFDFYCMICRHAAGKKLSLTFKRKRTAFNPLIEVEAKSTVKAKFSFKAEI